MPHSMNFNFFTQGFFIVNEQPSYDQDPLIEASLLSNKVKRINSFSESFGDVTDGEGVKKAFIVQRSDSIQEKSQSQEHLGHGTINSFEISSKSFSDSKATKYQKLRNKYKGKNYAEEASIEETNESVLHSQTPENFTSYPTDDYAHQDSGILNQNVKLDSTKIDVSAENCETSLKFGLTQRFSEQLVVEQKQHSDGAKTFVSFNQVDLSKVQERSEIERTKVTVRIGRSREDEGTRDSEKVYVATAIETDSSIRRNDSWDALDMNVARVTRMDEDKTTTKDGSHAEGISPNKLKVIISK